MIAQPLLEVRVDAVKGRGLYTLEAVEENAVVLRDDPIAVASMDAPRMSCAVCKRFVGSIQLHLLVLAEQVNVDSHVRSNEDMTLLPTMETDLSLPNLPSPVVPAYMTLYPSAAAPSIVCSQACRDILHVQPTHVFTPSQSFEALSGPGLDSDHILLVATLMAIVLHRLSMQTTLYWEDAVHDILNLCVARATPPLNVKVLKAAFQNVMAIFTAPSSSSEPAGAVQYFHDRMTLDMFERFVGIVQANAVGVQVPSPISRYFAACEDDPSIKTVLVARASTLVEAALNKLCEDETSGDEGSQEHGDDEPDDDSEDGDTIEFVWPQDSSNSDAATLCFSSSVLPDLGGLALFPRFSMLNHSCDPSCALAYTDDTAQITVFALRPLGPGDELTISYLDATAPFKTRQDELHTRYGFTCTCRRCISHPTDASKKKRQRVA
ncbi:hypothetical protein H310_02551 [Aphanomyces invadans]|uniref:SET domain-containing protein n=1 Tax=Aphanomyces invadans TaxID=157072 RepID=A0A024UK69_9STRA|nr:hypothetical protein H310_02551 [Aphanomyces invadans]ETW06257.1 hypothetical protein H310_02551 [Aphanomyces invadans]|eukprot:XP_008864332.1 hypothetical protein H310_02551 [Aphanomyces invadans]